MELTMGKREYFCIGNLGACKNTIDIAMIVAFTDGTEETFIGTNMERAGKKAGNTLFAENDELWIKTNQKDKSIVKVTLSLNNPNGNVEQYCLRWGIASFDDSINYYSVKWQDTILRSEEIALTVHEESVSICMCTKKHSKAFSVVKKGDTIEKTVEDIELCISADRKILAYYSGDARVETEALLNTSQEIYMKHWICFMTQKKSLQDVCIQL